MSRHGLIYDQLGDVAQNDGEEGHAQRHAMILQALASALKSVWGGQVRVEPQDYHSYSDYRPDLTVDGAGHAGSLLAADLKVKDDVGSHGMPPRRGAFVAFGNTRPAARKQVLGRPARGTPADPPFNSMTGYGYVAAAGGDYARARAAGVDVRLLLVSTFGGIAPEFSSLLKDLTEARANKLNSAEHDDTTWAARTWFSFVSQKLSVAIHHSVALEIAHALQLGTVVDPRGRAGHA